MKAKKKVNTNMRCPFRKRCKAHKKIFCSKSAAEPILNALFEVRSTNALEECLKNDKLYQKRERQLSNISGKLEQTGLNREQKSAIDEALSICNSQDSQYGRIAYGLGFRDAVHLMLEIFGPY